MWTRRAMMGGTAAAMAAAPSLARNRLQDANRDGWFDRAVVIDGLTGFSDPYGEAGHLRISDRAWAETQQTGLDAIRITLMPVGNGDDGWEAFEESVEGYTNYIGANPDRAVLVKEAADILAAKRAGKVGVIFGTQDTSMVAPICRGWPRCMRWARGRSRSPIICAIWLVMARWKNPMAGCRGWAMP